MTVELGLLLLESILLVATVILLIYNIHEGKQRDNLLKEVGRATRVLTRQEYFFTTKKGFKIPSEELAMILKNYYNSCEKQVTLKEYFREIVGQTGATPKHLAREFPLDVRELKQLVQ
jgi:hypothetical protein